MPPWMTISGSATRDLVGVGPFQQIVDERSHPETMADIRDALAIPPPPSSLTFELGRDRMLTAKLCVADQCAEAQCDLGPVLDVLADRFTAFHDRLHAETGIDGDRIGAIPPSGEMGAYYQYAQQQAQQQATKPHYTVTYHGGQSGRGGTPRGSGKYQVTYHSGPGAQGGGRGGYVGRPPTTPGAVDDGTSVHAQWVAAQQQGLVDKSGMPAAGAFGPGGTAGPYGTPGGAVSPYSPYGGGPAGYGGYGAPYGAAPGYPPPSPYGGYGAPGYDPSQGYGAGGYDPSQGYGAGGYDPSQGYGGYGAAPAPALPPYSGDPGSGTGGTSYGYDPYSAGYQQGLGDASRYYPQQSGPYDPTIDPNSPQYDPTAVLHAELQGQIPAPQQQGYGDPSAFGYGGYGY